MQNKRNVLKWMIDGRGIIMKKMYRIQKNEIVKTEKLKKDYWVDLITPNEKEIKSISKRLTIEEQDILKTLDKSELPHIEYEENYTLFIINIPYVTHTEKKKYRAHPFGLFLLEDGFLTISMKEHTIRNAIKSFIAKGNDLKNQKTFPIFLIGKSIEYFMKCLNEIQNDILKMEKTLIHSTSNKDLERMLDLKKSLLYFTTSLQGNRTLLEKMENSNLTEEETELLKDVQIEIRQAIEMANIYREILENTMDTYNSIISNNLNDIMKFLTSITLVISIPTMISSFLGMNVFFGDFGTNPYSFFLVIGIATFVTVLLIIILKKKNLL